MPTLHFRSSNAVSQYRSTIPLPDVHRLNLTSLSRFKDLVEASLEDTRPEYDHLQSLLTGCDLWKSQLHEQAKIADPGQRLGEIVQKQRYELEVAKRLFRLASTAGIFLLLPDTPSYNFVGIGILLISLPLVVMLSAFQRFRSNNFAYELSSAQRHLETKIQELGLLAIRITRKLHECVGAIHSKPADQG